MEKLTVDCASCSAPPAACGDCVISVLLGAPGPRAASVELAADEQAALATLASSGLVPPLRLVALEGPPDGDEGLMRRQA